MNLYVIYTQRIESIQQKMEENRTVTGPDSHILPFTYGTNVFLQLRTPPEEEVEASQQNLSRMQDLTADEALTLEPSTAHRSGNKALVTQKGLLPNKPLEVKTHEIGLKGTEKIGQDWIIIGFVMYFINLMNSFWNKMKIPKYKLYYSIYSFTCLLLNLCFYSWCTAEQGKNNVIILFILSLMVAIIDITNLIFTGMDVYKQYFRIDLFDSFETIRAWIQCAYTAFSFFVAIAMILNRNFWAVVFAVCACVVVIIHAANVVVCFLLSPLLVLTGIAECLIRIMICKAQCPKVRQRCVKYQYGLYKFSPLMAQSSLKCAICLEEYTLRSSNLVVLLCGTHHVFHEACIFEWLRSKKYCPICRGPVHFLSV